MVTDKFFNEFLSYCKEKGVEPKENEIEISGPELKKYLKGFVLRNLFDFNSYLRYLNRDDREILKALEVLKEPAAI